MSSCHNLLENNYAPIKKTYQVIAAASHFSSVYFRFGYDLEAL